MDTDLAKPTTAAERPSASKPILSIIVTNYNYNAYLPGLLDNIQEQSVKNVEVVLVDDCSDTSPKDIVLQEKYASMNIVFIQNEHRLYTKDTRLKGVEAASADLVTFIDADDKFYKTSALEYLVNQTLEHDVDILHFPVVTVNADGYIEEYLQAWASPFADRLEGLEVFRSYVKSGCQGHTVWGKIIKRTIWMNCMAFAKASPIKRYQEDFFLMSLLFFHARSYLGSNRIGLLHEYIDRTVKKAAGRTATNYHMFSEFIPYIEANGADADTVLQLKTTLIGGMSIFLDTFLRTRRKNLASDISKTDEHIEDTLAELSEYTDPETLLRILLTVLLDCGDRQAHSSDTDKSTGRTAITRLANITNHSNPLHKEVRNTCSPSS